MNWQEIHAEMNARLAVLPEKGITHEKIQIEREYTSRFGALVGGEFAMEAEERRVALHAAWAGRDEEFTTALASVPEAVFTASAETWRADANQKIERQVGPIGFGRGSIRIPIPPWELGGEDDAHHAARMGWVGALRVA